MTMLCWAPISAHWRDLLILSWPVEDDTLTPYLPNSFTLDRWEDRAYISLVGLYMDDVKVLGLPAYPRRFSEINLRFYVRPQCDHDQRRGVVFLKQMVAHPLVAAAGRRLFREPMSSVPIVHECSEEEMPGGGAQIRLRYALRFNRREQMISATAADDWWPAEPGSIEEFLTARYWGYKAQSAGPVRAYQISRDPWRLTRVHDCDLDFDHRVLFGPQVAETLNDPPSSALMAHGSRARVYWPSHYACIGAGNAATQVEIVD